MDRGTTLNDGVKKILLEIHMEGCVFCLSQLISCRQETLSEEKVLGTCETQRKKKYPVYHRGKKMCICVCMCILLDLTHIDSTCGSAQNK